MTYPMRANALLAVAAALTLAGGSYFSGYSAATNKYEAGLLKDERARTAQLLSEVKRGETASNGLQLDLRDLGTDYQQLQKAFNDYRNRKTPLVRSHATPAAPGIAAQTDPQGCLPNDAQSGAEPVLTHGAAWMWNSALVGADTPSGACGLADQSDEACAVDSGLTLEDAWDNHTLNAQACAADRLRFQHLIDFVKERL